MIPCDPQRQTFVLELHGTGLASIQVQEVVRRVVCDINVRLLIAIDIDKQDAQTFAVVLILSSNPEARSGRHILKRAITPIPP